MFFHVFIELFDWSLTQSVTFDVPWHITFWWPKPKYTRKSEVNCVSRSVTLTYNQGYAKINVTYIYICIYLAGTYIDAYIFYTPDSKLNNEYHPISIQHASPYPKKKRTGNFYPHFNVYLCI